MISLEDLISKLQVESQNRKCDAILIRENYMNLVEHNRTEKNKIPPQATLSFKKHTVAKKFSGTCDKWVIRLMFVEVKLATQSKSDQR